MKTFKRYLEEASYQNYNPRVQVVPGWSTPEGMSTGSRGVGTVDNPNDPDSSDGSSLSQLTPDEMAAFKSEIERFGGSMMLSPVAARAIKNLESTPAWREFKFSKAGVRWAIRPPITNKLAGGIANSYHQDGLAIDAKHGLGGNVDDETVARLIYFAYQSGIRGIGFGATQIHLDARPGTNMMIYQYRSWGGSVAGVIKRFTGQSISSPAPDRTGISSRPNTNASIIAELGRAIGLERAPEPEPEPVPEPEPTPAVPGRRPEAPKRGFDKFAADVKDLNWKEVGSNAATAGVIAGILAVGFFGIRRLFRRRDERSEAERLLSDPVMRAKLAQLRSKHRDIISDARYDPRSRAELERIIARGLSDARDSRFY